MSENKVNIELDKALLDEIFQVAGLPIPESYSPQAVKSAFAIIKSKLGGSGPPPMQAAQTMMPPPQMQASPNLPMPPSAFNAPSAAQVNASMGFVINDNKQKSVLVVDDLGIIIYQVSTLLKKLGYDVVSSQEMNDAIKKFKEKDFSFTILDLFIPTEREGFLLLDEIKKISLLCKLDTKIIVMSASPKDSHKIQAYKHGANAFVEKAQGWQKRIMEEILALSSQTDVPL